MALAGGNKKHPISRQRQLWKDNKQTNKQANKNEALLKRLENKDVWTA